MKKASAILLLVALTIVASMTGLGVNVCETNSKQIGTLDGIVVDSASNSLGVTVKPTSAALADRPYVVDLYEAGGHLKAGTTVTWNQTQLNAQQSQPVQFPITSQEVTSYSLLSQKQLRETFSIRVHE